MQNRLSETNPLVAKYYTGLSGLSRKLALRYDQESNEEDFLQIALMTALGLEKSFDESKGSFYTYCLRPVEVAIYEAFGNPQASTKTYKVITKAIKLFEDTHGYYPDVSQISEVTKLSTSEIINVYYDKYRDVSLQSLKEDVVDETESNWVEDHFKVLTEPELLLIDALYYREQSIADLSNTLGIPISKLKVTRDKALEKLKLSIGDFK